MKPPFVFNTTRSAVKPLGGSARPRGTTPIPESKHGRRRTHLPLQRASTRGQRRRSPGCPPPPPSPPPTPPHKPELIPYSPEAGGGAAPSTPIPPSLSQLLLCALMGRHTGRATNRTRAHPIFSKCRRRRGAAGSLLPKLRLPAQPGVVQRRLCLRHHAGRCLHGVTCTSGWVSARRCKGGRQAGRQNGVPKCRQPSRSSAACAQSRCSGSPAAALAPLLRLGPPPLCHTCGGAAVASRMHMAAASAAPYALKNSSSLVASRCSSSCGWGGGGSARDRQVSWCGHGSCCCRHDWLYMQAELGGVRAAAAAAVGGEHGQMVPSHEPVGSSAHLRKNVHRPHLLNLQHARCGHHHKARRGGQVLRRQLVPHRRLQASQQQRRGAGHAPAEAGRPGGWAGRADTNH